MAEQFVPAADEVWRLQTGDDPECVFFRRAVRGKTDISRGTMQGMYVFSPSGERLGRINSTNPDKVAAMLVRALERRAELPDAARLAPTDGPTPRSTR